MEQRDSGFSHFPRFVRVCGNLTSTELRNIETIYDDIITGGEEMLMMNSIL